LGNMAQQPGGCGTVNLMRQSRCSYTPVSPRPLTRMGRLRGNGACREGTVKARFASGAGDPGIAEFARVGQPGDGAVAGTPGAFGFAGS
jgi:hypothetical protein